MRISLVHPETTLTQIANKINIEIRDIRNGFMKIGELLCAARERLPGDKEFGQWCEDQGFQMHRTTRYKLMAVYRRFNGVISDVQGHQKKMPSLKLLFAMKDMSDGDLENAIAEELTVKEAKEVAKEGSWDTWKAKKDAQREAGAAMVSGTDPEAPTRAREAADDVLSKQQDRAKIDEAKKNVNPDGEYIPKNEMDEAERNRRIEEIHARVLAENPDLVQEFEEEDKIDRVRNKIDSLGTNMTEEQRQDRAALSEAISTINLVWNPENLQMMTLQKATRAFALWQVIVREYLNEDH